jgi:predicted NodU family carbamoyl transferase
MKIVGINTSHDTAVCQYDPETDTLDFMHEEDRFRREKYWSPKHINRHIDVDQHHDVLAAIYKGGVETPDELVFASYDRRQLQLDFDRDKLLEDRMKSIELANFIAEKPVTKARFEEIIENYKEYIMGHGVGGQTEEIQINDGFCSQFSRDGEQLKRYYFWYEHHLYHAYCGYHLSPYYQNDEDSIAIVWDGGGAQINFEDYPNYQEIESIYRMSKGKRAERQWVLSTNHRWLGDLNGATFPNTQTDMLDFKGENITEEIDGVSYEYTSRASNGMDFSNLSHALGCDEQGRAAGKVMGMASYASSDQPWKRFNKYQYAQDLELHAFDESCKTIQKAIDLNPDCKNIVLSGGYSLNCTNNYKYLSAFPDHQFFVDPIPHDGGTAFGATIHLNHLLLEQSVEDNNIFEETE